MDDFDGSRGRYYRSKTASETVRAAKLSKFSRYITKKQGREAMSRFRQRKDNRFPVNFIVFPELFLKAGAPHRTDEFRKHLIPPLSATQ
ncbi:MAG: hypothetical protein A2270_03735 [Elusimicrobia bacterium RIFOXYA12_FULL_51_18]|nr:MAG: hypothetical protein A2270_03735 [Elusimicrobia bacterium RIFOXYA12_FULL_51_18]OGS29863.1 MAG: hypothetical protein A2218_02435 [Elusimicrobia bacterium RIFOXYA2_FULL_53_38]